jgi:glycosyltransferase involved in cell wall biosynthesis
MTYARSFTVLIAARNAAATIARAVLSVRDEADAIVLVDDGSTDATVSVAREAGGDTLSVVTRMTPDGSGGPLGATRELGLRHVTTPFAAWLDADDEFVPGRIGRLSDALRRGADVVADETSLVDGLTGAPLRDVPLPEWVRDDVAPARLFARNALPAIGLVGFRTAAWQRLGYDETLHGAEDVDILLRGIAAGLRFHWLRVPGTRVHIYPSSLSRRRDRQRASYARALRKHSYAGVRMLLAAAGASPAVTSRALASMAMFREDPAGVLAFVDEAEWIDERPTWPITFMRGTAHLLAGDDLRAITALRAAESLQPTAEGANNLGIALARTGEIPASHEAFRLGLARRPDYEDAAANLAAETPTRITTHPLRAWDASEP